MSVTHMASHFVVLSFSWRCWISAQIGKCECSLKAIEARKHIHMSLRSYVNTCVYLYACLCVRVYILCTKMWKKVMFCLHMWQACIAYCGTNGEIVCKLKKYMNLIIRKNVYYKTKQNVKFFLLIFIFRKCRLENFFFIFYCRY